MPHLCVKIYVTSSCDAGEDTCKLYDLWRKYGVQTVRASSAHCLYVQNVLDLGEIGKSGRIIALL